MGEILDTVYGDTYVLSVDSASCTSSLAMVEVMGR